MDTHENQCGLNANTPERALDDAAESLPEEELLYDLADLFKVFSDTHTHQDPLCPHER